MLDRLGRVALASLVLALAVSATRAALAQDCDGDGIADRDEVAVRLDFAAPLVRAVGDEPTTLAIVDLDRDGRLDVLVTSTTSGSLSVLLSSAVARGTAPAVAAELCLGVDPRGVAAGDVDGDGIVDVVCGIERRQDETPATAQTRVVVLRGDGAGGLAPRCAPPCDDVPEPSCRTGDVAALERAADAIRTLALVDLDDDAALDIVVGFRSARGDGTVSVLRGDGAGGFATAVEPNASPLVDSRYVAIADIDHSGGADILTAGGDLLRDVVTAGGVRVLPRESFASVDLESRGIAIADVSGDGVDDVLLALSATTLVGESGGTLLVLRGSPDGSLESLPQPGLAALCDLLESLAVGDLDGDGDLDVVVTITGRTPRSTCVDPGVRVLLNEGGGSFVLGPFVPFVETRPRWIEIGDFDDDGRLDVVVALDTLAGGPGGVAFLLNRRESGGDVDRNGLPDDCQFARGDVDGDLRVTLSDAVTLLDWLFRQGATPACLEAADADDNARVDLSDAVRILGFLFRGDAALPPPLLAVPGRCEWSGSWRDPNGLIGCERGCAI